VVESGGSGALRGFDRYVNCIAVGASREVGHTMVFSCTADKIRTLAAIVAAAVLLKADVLAEMAMPDLALVEEKARAVCIVELALERRPCSVVFLHTTCGERYHARCRQPRLDDDGEHTITQALHIPAV